MSRPRLLDLFCGAGGAARGYYDAGFDVIGVDLADQPNYPYPFVQGDALAFLERGGGPIGFDAIHASPPCQAYSQMSRRWDREHPDLVAPTRELLQATGLPYVIENVINAPLTNPTTLCGSSFHLGCQCRDGKWRNLRRHRLFESSWLMMFPPPCICDHSESIGVYGHGGGRMKTVRNGGVNRGYMGNLAECQAAMGIDWMTKAEISQAIPPAYTEYIGLELLRQLAATA